jgi:hypothetical protein
MNADEHKAIDLLIEDLEAAISDISAQIESTEKMMMSGNSVNPIWFSKLHRARAAKQRELKKLKARKSGLPEAALDDAVLRKQIQLENMRNATSRKELQFLAQMQPQDLASRFMLAARKALSHDLYAAILASTEDQGAA